MKDLKKTDTSHWQGSDSPLPAPALPEGFTAHGEPIPLISIRDEWWIVLAHCQTHDLDGLLIFEEKRVVTFLVAEEAITIAALVLERLPQLLQRCAPDYLESRVHADGVNLLRGAWWSREAEKRCALGSCTEAGGDTHADG